MPASDASIPWVVPLFSAIQSAKMPCALSPWMRNSASSGVESPVEPLISPISVSSPAHAGMRELTARFASRFWSLGWWDASMAMDVMPASNIVGISTMACARSLSFFMP